MRGPYSTSNNINLRLETLDKYWGTVHELHNSSLDNFWPPLPVRNAFMYWALCPHPKANPSPSLSYMICRVWESLLNRDWIVDVIARLLPFRSKYCDTLPAFSWHFDNFILMLKYFSSSLTNLGYDYSFWPMFYIKRMKFINIAQFIVC